MSTPLGEMKDLSYQSSIAKKGDTYQIAWKPSLIFFQICQEMIKISIQVDNAKRGEIVDRNGSGLAINKVFDEVGVVPWQTRFWRRKKQPISKLFSDKFGVSVDEINQKVKPRMGPSRLLCTNHSCF